MMLPLQLMALLVLLVATTVGPGLLLVRRLQWRPLETLGAAVALSHFLVYAAGMAIYALGVPTAACYGISLLCAAATAACWTELRALWSRQHIRHVVYAVAGLFVWVLLMQLVVRNYTGGNWYGDWFEHYERARFFLDRPDVNTSFFFGRYILPARPPLMNVVAAFYMAQVGSGFEIFQVVFTFLNVLPVLAAALLLPLLLPKARRPILLLAVLYALNPLFVHNAFFTWTKLYTAFLVLLGLALYLRGWRSAERSRLIAAFATLAAATLTHYSAGPFLLFVALHYMVAVFWRRSRRWSELAGIVGVGTFVLATWFAWSIHTYGVRDTLERNTTVAGYAGGGQTLAGAAYNLYATVVPYPVRGLPVVPMAYRTNPLAELRDWFFHLYQTNLVLGLGSIGWLLVLIVCVRSQREKVPRQRRERRFWLGFLLISIPLAIATNGEPASYGLAHVSAQPIVLLALAVLAAGFTRLPVALRLLLPVGLAVDYLVGIHLHVQLQSVVFRVVPSGGGRTIDLSSGLGYGALNNFLMKHDTGLVFLGDHMTAWQPLLEAAMVCSAFAMILYVLRQGRYRRGRPAPALHAQPVTPMSTA